MYVPNCGGLHKNANKDLHISLKIITFAAEFPKCVTKMGKNNNEEIENSIFFENNYSFSCVFALFVVPLSPIK